MQHWLRTKRRLTSKKKENINKTALHSSKSRKRGGERAGVRATGKIEVINSKRRVLRRLFHSYLPMRA